MIRLPKISARGQRFHDHQTAAAEASIRFTRAGQAHRHDLCALRPHGHDLSIALNRNCPQSVAPVANAEELQAALGEIGIELTVGFVFGESEIAAGVSSNDDHPARADRDGAGGVACRAEIADYGAVGAKGGIKGAVEVVATKHEVAVALACDDKMLRVLHCRGEVRLV